MTFFGAAERLPLMWYPLSLKTISGVTQKLSAPPRDSWLFS